MGQQVKEIIPSAGDYVINQNQIPELQRLKTLTLGNDSSDQGVKLPSVGSIRKIIIKVDTSGVVFTGGTSPSLVPRAPDLFLKNFTLTFNDGIFGKADIFSGTFGLMAYRQFMKTKKNSSDVKGEFIIDFPVKNGFNSMLPAGRSIEFSMDYTTAGVGELATGSPTAIDGIIVTIDVLRYQHVYSPSNRVIYKNRTITVSQTGDKEIEFPNGHLYKELAFITYNSSDALSDIVNSIKINNDGRLITDLRPKGWRAYANDVYGNVPSNGVIFHSLSNLLQSKELKAVADISDATNVEFYSFTQEVF